MDVLTTPFTPPIDAGAVPYEGYDEATVDDFLRAVEAERSRLQAELDEAGRREQRARVLINMHEVMVATMRDAYADVTAIRRAAEATAAQVMADAARRAVQLGTRVDA
jgi:cell division septum initiation protein DivIVA